MKLDKLTYEEVVSYQWRKILKLQFFFDKCKLE